MATTDILQRKDFPWSGKGIASVEEYTQKCSAFLKEYVAWVDSVLGTTSTLTGELTYSLYKYDKSKQFEISVQKPKSTTSDVSFSVCGVAITTLACDADATYYSYYYKNKAVVGSGASGDPRAPVIVDLGSNYGSLVFTRGANGAYISTSVQNYNTSISASCPTVAGIPVLLITGGGAFVPVDSLITVNTSLKGGKVYRVNGKNWICVNKPTSSDSSYLARLD